MYTPYLYDIHTNKHRYTKCPNLQCRVVVEAWAQLSLWSVKDGRRGDPGFNPEERQQGGSEGIKHILGGFILVLHYLRYDLYDQLLSCGEKSRGPRIEP